ncbi:hypothetical protein J1N35_006367 [Gossypium stocksii]|uniref:Uncharacterized protein n=1 Tax=Gossypium stocksii TaxID=47602 RepID=A0A9D3WFU7_9ROSI|nr:hypothetical protein J1N35_006367 [Gossypium stocksii]
MKAGGHTATPHPSKKAGKTSAAAAAQVKQTPKSGGSFPYKSYGSSIGWLLLHSPNAVGTISLTVDEHFMGLIEGFMGRNENEKIEDIFIHFICGFGLK